MEKTPESYLMQSEEEGNGASSSRPNYQSEENSVGFSDFAGQPNNPIIDREKNDPSTDGELPIILLHIETSGLGRDREILKITAKRSIKEFEIYVCPEEKISVGASEINGLTCHNRVLRYLGEPVPSVSLMIAMKNLLSWLTLQFDKQCYIAIHNLSFGGPRLFDAIKSCHLRNDFSKVIYGFIDTLNVIRKDTGRKGKEECKIEVLAEWLNVSSDAANYALCKMEMLSEILEKLNIGYETLIQDAKTYSDQFHQWDHVEYINPRALLCLKPLEKVVGLSIQKKMVMASITIEDLEYMYANSGQEGLTELLSREVGGKPLVTKHKNTIQKIIKWIQTNWKQNVAPGSAVPKSAISKKKI